MRGAPDECDSLINIERLRQIFEGASLIRGDGTSEIRVSRHDNDGQRRPRVANLLQELQARLTGHPYIGDEHVRLLTPKCIERGLGGFECSRRHTTVAEGALQHPANGGVVVDEPYAQ